MLSLSGCRRRQQRLLARMEEERLDLFVTGNFRTAYYFTGSLAAADAPVIFAIRQDGRSVLVTPANQSAAADELIVVETYSIDRVIDQPVRDAAVLFREDLLRQKGTVTRYGVERAATPGIVESALSDLYPNAGPHDASQIVLDLRKRKDEEEIDEIRRALNLNAAAYRAARNAIVEGRTELDVFNDLQTAVVLEAGTFVPLAGDFAAGERAIRGGGPPTPRIIEKNDLYILDLFPAPHVYFGDTCRTFAASIPTDLQEEAWEIVTGAVRIGEEAVKPGVRARDVYAAIKRHLDSFPIAENSFWHHGGHGIGLHGHEAPRIIPGSDDVFEVGDVITLEPGIYTKALRGGIRLEDNYVVREHGLEKIFHFPTDL
ncbi:MAG TPA: M24 family metallopeptidase [Bryobacteraceae bacterium]|nr:M24 family metallopeptidase [Bryobacteraceae bacterium]